MTDNIVLYEIRNRVAIVTLNRPERMNAWTPELQDAYFSLLRRATADPEVRAVIVTGAGRGFCAGADTRYLDTLKATGAVLNPETSRTSPITVPKLLVGAINGACAGIGLLQALLCDVRIAAEGAKFTTSFARLGLVAEHGMAWLLPRVVGRAVASDLLLSGRVVEATEALELGLVHRVVPPQDLLDDALRYACDVADHCSPASVAMIKQQLLDAEGLEADRVRASVLVDITLAGPDFLEGVASYTEKRPPNFAPLGRGTRFDL